MPPLFIVLDGPDGSGTTTHARLLAEKLQGEGKRVLLTSEPTTGPIGTSIRQMLRGTDPPPPDALQLLFCADRAWHVEHLIKPALAAGTIVVCDRYTPSTIIYGEAKGIDSDWMKNLNSKFIQPHCQIFTLPPLETCLVRVGKRGERELFEDPGMQRIVHKGYRKYADKDPSIHAVDTAGSKEKAAQQIWAIIRPLLA